MAGSPNYSGTGPILATALCPTGTCNWPGSGNQPQQDRRLALQARIASEHAKRCASGRIWDYTEILLLQWWRIHDLPPLLRHPLIVATYTANIGAAVTKLVGICSCIVNTAIAWSWAGASEYWDMHRQVLTVYEDSRSITANSAVSDQTIPGLRVASTSGKRMGDYAQVHRAV